MLSRTHGAHTPSQENSYQATGSEASCACSSHPYGLTDVRCITHAEPHTDELPVCPHCNGGPERLALVELDASGAPADERQPTLFTMPVTAWCPVCWQRFPLLKATPLRRQPATLVARGILATFRGHCPFCSRNLHISETRPVDGEWAVLADVRFREAGFHQVPACAEFLGMEVVDLTLRVLGVSPTGVRHG